MSFDLLVDTEIQEECHYRSRRCLTRRSLVGILCGPPTQLDPSQVLVRLEAEYHRQCIKGPQQQNGHSGQQSEEQITVGHCHEGKCC